MSNKTEWGSQWMRWKWRWKNIVCFVVLVVISITPTQQLQQIKGCVWRVCVSVKNTRTRICVVVDFLCPTCCCYCCKKMTKSTARLSPVFSFLLPYLFRVIRFYMKCVLCCCCCCDNLHTCWKLKWISE